MSEDMPWVIGLTQEEVEELRSKKQELTQYGKEKIRELMNNQEPYPDAMFEEAERREAANKQMTDEEYDKFVNIQPRKTLEEMTRKERVDSAIQEIWYLVQGGQNGREYADSIFYIIKVLESLV